MDLPQSITTRCRPADLGTELYVSEGLTVVVTQLADGTIVLKHTAGDEAGRQLLVRRVGRTPRGRRKPRAM